ncbi:AbiU2 domain-containing protein [Caldovatus aquaticus]|uniref:HEPN AbiU2-like domain-containing protein n=1 Tax=Caldovatus aquaticus TaxID=2865671 RepID=A0ABS7F198_9PROT|nr:hypothetical protein [Caldovatus aquaticus]
MEKRKRAQSANAYEWISAYMADVYEQNDQYFDRLLFSLSERYGLYRTKIRPIRNQIYAHTVFSTYDDKIQKIHEKVFYSDLVKLAEFINDLHDTLWQLFHNGSMSFTRAPWDVAAIVADLDRNGAPRTTRHEIVRSVRDLLRTLVAAPRP